MENRELYRVYLILGSNMGDRRALLDAAVLELMDALMPDYLEVGALNEAVDTTPVMETEPWGFQAEQKFLNQVFCCLTECGPQRILQICQETETALGRERKAPQFDAAGKRIYESRPIDVDILYLEKKSGDGWKKVEVNTENLVIPHPQLGTRDYAKRLFDKIRKLPPRKK